MNMQRERLKWLELLLRERFGHKWKLAPLDRGIALTLEGEPGQLVLDTHDPAFMRTGKPLDLACNWWQVESPWESVLGEGGVPAPASRPLREPLIENLDGHWVCHYDILGLAFWCMNRLEEVGAETLDDHQRFPASESHAEKNGYLDRPIADEWLDILGQVIQAQWPGVELKKHQFEIVLSHDVDRPSRYGFSSLKGLVRAVGGDVIKRGDYKSIFVAPWVRFNTRNKLHPLDAFNTFDWIMGQSEKIGIQSTFNFICDTDHGAYEADYELEHPAIRKLLRDVYKRGHKIGIHPSYNCYLNPGKIRSEFDKLKKICQEEGVEQAEWGGRMHYLRWSHPQTAIAWDDAGVSYDSTLGFAGKAGFRCGTCHEFPVYDVAEEKILNVRERPLVAMEGAILSPQYMGVKDHKAAKELLVSLKEKCQKVGGGFTLLWHNSELNTPELRSLYCEVVF